jgi:hypothetical protein
MINKEITKEDSIEMSNLTSDEDHDSDALGEAFDSLRMSDDIKSGLHDISALISALNENPSSKGGKTRKKRKKRTKKYLKRNKRMIRKK